MGRREFIKLLGGVSLWPLSATAQPPQRVRQVGVLMSYLESETEAQEWVRVFVRALEALGWRDGVNLKLHYRWRGAGPEVLRVNAAELGWGSTRCWRELRQLRSRSKEPRNL